jgi:hypothetical protein
MHQAPGRSRPRVGSIFFGAISLNLQDGQPPQHMEMHREWQARALADELDLPIDGIGRRPQP